jgi:hypothetical protein
MISQISAVTDPKYGVKGGWSCFPLGDDVIRVNDSVCVNGFEVVFFLRIVFAIFSFCALVALYCSACTTIRHYNQLTIMKKLILQDKNKNLKAEITR